jgi:cytochrome o ubiquinol oxidase subunit 1
MNHKKNADVTGDPWGGRTLEWSLSSPPPFYNFATTPVITEKDPLVAMRENGTVYDRPAHYQDIHMPRNTSCGLIMGVFSAFFGFGFIWYIWWMVGFGALGMLITLIVRMFQEDVDYYVPAAQVKEIEDAYLKTIGTQA